MSEQKIDMDKAVEALLPYCWQARIHGKWVHGGRYYAWRRQFIALTIIQVLYVGLITCEAFSIVAEVERLMR